MDVQRRTYDPEHDAIRRVITWHSVAILILAAAVLVLAIGALT